VPQAGQPGPPAQPLQATGGGAPRDVAVTQAAESIAPTPPPAGQSPVGTPFDPALLQQLPRPGNNTATSEPPSGAGGQGGAGDTSGFFEGGPQARSVVYVIDRSASMGPKGLLAAAVRELCASLARLPPATQFQVVVYHDQPEVLLAGREELVPATPENTEQAARLLKAVSAEGGTNHLQALRLALSLGPEVVYLLTDADDLRDEDRREVTRINRGRAVIHTIELNTSNRDRADMPLQVLARENGGRYRAVDLRQ
jgi:hypothetical protein